MKQDFEIWMIRIKDDPVSESYANYCLQSWKDFEVNIFDAVTPKTLMQHNNELVFGKKGNTGVDVSQTEAACFLSQYLIWKRCWEEDKPILVLEHDAFLLKPDFIKYDPRFFVQLFGRFAMEAVMFTPEMVELMFQFIKNKQNCITYGPLSMIEQLCIGSFQKQAGHSLPHARFLGPHAPVTCVIDPKLGNTISHTNITGLETVNDYRKNNELQWWKLIDLGLDPSLAKTHG